MLESLTIISQIHLQNFTYFSKNDLKTLWKYILEKTSRFEWRSNGLWAHKFKNVCFWNFYTDLFPTYGFFKIIYFNRQTTSAINISIFGASTNFQFVVCVFMFYQQMDELRIYSHRIRTADGFLWRVSNSFNINFSLLSTLKTNIRQVLTEIQPKMCQKLPQTDQSLRKFATLPFERCSVLHIMPSPKIYNEKRILWKNY